MKSKDKRLFAALCRRRELARSQIARFEEGLGRHLSDPTRKLQIQNRAQFQRPGAAPPFDTDRTLTSAAEEARTPVGPTRLKDQPQPKLNLPGIANRVGRNSEPRTRQGAIWKPERMLVQDVEKLGAELQQRALEKLRILGQR